MSSHHEWIDEQIRNHEQNKPFAPENGQPLQFQVGDSVIYTNPYGVTFQQKIIGLYTPLMIDAFYAVGCRYYLDTDCAWLPVKQGNLERA